MHLRERVRNIEKETLVNHSALHLASQVRVKVRLEGIDRRVNVLETARTQQDPERRLVQNCLDVANRASRLQTSVHNRKINLSAVFLDHNTKLGQERVQVVKRPGAHTLDGLLAKERADLTWHNRERGHAFFLEHRLGALG